MNKNEVLNAIEELSRTDQISKEELMNAYSTAKGISANGSTGMETIELQEDAKHFNVSDVLYYIGGAIVFIGVAVMIGGSWGNLSDVARISVTLGLGIVFYIIGALLSNAVKFGGVSTAFFLTAGLTIPVGIFVLLDTIGIQTYTAQSNVIVSLILVICFLASHFAFKKSVLTVFTILYSTWLFMSATNMLFDVGQLGWEFYAYRVLAIGLSYIAIGYAFSLNKQLKNLRGWLYSFGSLLFLGAAIALPGVFWEIIYPGLIFGIIMLSIKMKAKAFLVWGSLFLMGYIGKITATHFSTGLGWPVSLMIAGLALVGIGYYAFYLNKKYLSKTSEEN